MRTEPLELLLVAVPKVISDTVGRLDTDERLALARECGQVVASQGDALMFRSGRPGQGAKQKRAHKKHGDARVPECADCPDTGKQPRCCMRRFIAKCRVCTTGALEYSSAEVFAFLATGVACAAFQPGGITFAGMHFCTDHDACKAAARTGKTP
jgi:hypothetical protein